MRLESIGFYSLSDERAATASATSPLQRCELILTGNCNFSCPYCRRVGGPNLSFDDALNTVRLWAKDRLRCIRFSGGEPTMWPRLEELVTYAHHCGMEWIAVSSNGSMGRHVYDRLIEAGVNDFSISLDACCAEDGDKMAGGVKGAWAKVISNIEYLSTRVYTTVGVVLTPENAAEIGGTIDLAESLGVSDIRVIPAAQCSRHLMGVPSRVWPGRFPILQYRMNNVRNGRSVRGIGPRDSHRCGLALDDMAVMGTQHYPCIIHMREGGAPIGQVGANMRAEREQWYKTHDTHSDPICQANCLDVCRQYNNVFERTNPVAKIAFSINTTEAIFATETRTEGASNPRAATTSLRVL